MTDAAPFREAHPPSTETVVRSIRVASTLVDRFKAIIKTSTSMMTVDQLELLIGESQQIYPEIWRHLDDASKELVRLGRDVSQFNNVRREELGHLGVTDVDVSHHIDYLSLMLGSYRQLTVKAAAFNVGGCQRAAYAVGTLMNTMPEVDWEALAQAEAREIAAAGSMQTQKYLTILKIAGGVIALIVVVILVRKLAMSSPEAEYHRERVAKEQDPAVEMRREALAARLRRIDGLWEQFAKECKTPVRLELARLLRADNRIKDAEAVEHKACVPRRPECSDGMRDLIAQRLLPTLPRTHDLVPRCEGILMSPGQLMPALAITFAGKPLLRGVVGVDGELDIVQIGEAPAPILAGFGDLDGDNADEMVMIGPDKLVVSRIAGRAFVDIAGSVLKAGCAANVTVEHDFRNGRKGERQRLVITVEGLQRRDCLAEGRHYFRLAGDKLVED